MRTELTQEQTDFYQENGYIIIEDFLSPDELETWRRQVEDAVAQRDGRITAGGIRSSERIVDEESAYFDKVFVHRQNLWIDHAGMRELMWDPRLGKMVSELAGDRPGRRLMIGDGVSDLATREVVDLFVGYGGVSARDAVREHADAFIHCPSLAPLLPVAAGPAGWRRLRGTAHQALFEKGLRLAQSGQLSLNRDPLRQAFAGAFASETT